MPGMHPGMVHDCMRLPCTKSAPSADPPHPPGPTPPSRIPSPSWEVLPGTTLLFVVDGYRGSAGKFTLSLEFEASQTQRLLALV